MRYKIFNTFIDAYTFDETLEKIKHIIENRIPTQHVVLNASKINLMQEDNKLTDIVNQCPLINADGASIVWAARKMKIPVPERVTGVDLFRKLVELSNETGYRIFLFGATEQVVLAVRQRFEKQYPNIQIVGTRNGYFKPEESLTIAKEIAATNADILFVAFSSPMKEYWIHKHFSDLKIPFVMGVGGSFDIVAGITKRAPLWMQNAGLEWFYRLIQEPRRMFKRYLVGNTKFVLLTFRELLHMNR